MTTACSGMNYGQRPQAMSSSYGATQSLYTQHGEFDTFEPDDSDKAGMWLAVGVAVAAGLAASILLPLYLSDKL